MIEFVMNDNKEDGLVFSSVPENCFFIGEDGYLCQKSSRCHYTIISTSSGDLFSTCREVVDDFKVRKIYRNIKGIRFD